MGNCIEADLNADLLLSATKQEDFFLIIENVN